MTGIPGPRERRQASPWPFVGMIAMACVAFLIGASVLVVPWYVVALLLVLWALVLFVATAWWSLHPTWVPWLPVGVAVVWFVTVVAGTVAFGWG